jgi:hypothetical protein
MSKKSRHVPNAVEANMRIARICTLSQRCGLLSRCQAGCMPFRRTGDEVTADDIKGRLTIALIPT